MRLCSENWEAPYAPYRDRTKYTYDANGNRLTGNGSTYTTPNGTHNRLQSDGTYDYEYDDDGNRTKRTKISDGSITEYQWDHRNRLIRVTERVDEGGVILKDVIFSYDTSNRRLGKRVVIWSGGAMPDPQRYVYDGDHIALQFGDVDGDGFSSAAELTNRYLHGPKIDEILADEQVTAITSPGDVIWPLTDNLGSVRDLATYNSVTDITTIDNHIVYDAFGNVTSESGPSVQHIFGFTGRQTDAETGLQHNQSGGSRGRWYDPQVGLWLSEDPIGFAGTDANLYRYVGNGPTYATDPSGEILFLLKPLLEAGKSVAIEALVDPEADLWDYVSGAASGFVEGFAPPGIGYGAKAMLAGIASWAGQSLESIGRGDDRTFSPLELALSSVLSAPSKLIGDVADGFRRSLTDSYNKTLDQLILDPDQFAKVFDSQGKGVITGYLAAESLTRAPDIVNALVKKAAGDYLAGGLDVGPPSKVVAYTYETETHPHYVYNPLTLLPAIVADLSEIDRHGEALPGYWTSFRRFKITVYTDGSKDADPLN